MKIKAQVSMVLNLDKCLGCHTCSITCKNTWTNREGAEYMYFNNVETRPGVGYPRHWEDQEKWKGGWTLDNSGKLALSTGSKTNRLMKLFFHPEQPELKDYFEPWTYEFLAGLHAGVWSNVGDIVRIRESAHIFRPKMDAESAQELCRRWHKAVERAKDWE